MYPPPPNQPPPLRYPPFPPKPQHGAQPTPPPPPPSYGRYEDYSPAVPSRPSYAYEQPRKSFDEDVYDPYQPSSTSFASTSQIPMPAPTLPISLPHMPPFPPTSLPSALPPRPVSPPKPTRRLSRPTDSPSQDLSVITPPTTMTVGKVPMRMHSLPPSHLPITKYIACSGPESIDAHRNVCTSGIVNSVWYAVGSTRAGEGWCSALEWNLDSGMSGTKMRGCVNTDDQLDTELAAINKAIDAFRTHLEQSIKAQKPTSHELVIFCDSPAAIVSIDTSSRTESIRFCDMWRGICSDFLQAHLTLVWIAKGTAEVEGYSLALKIATVAASNSYLRRRKERSIPEIYTRPGSSDIAPPSSSIPGPWQRGDADPSHHKAPFQRPVVTPQSPRAPLAPVHLVPEPVSSTNGLEPAETAEPAAEEEGGLRPRADVLCVTHFPNSASAKELGILFAQFGEIVSVDIFSIPPVNLRFAYVAYTQPHESNIAAIQRLHQRPIQPEPSFARKYEDDLAIWKSFSGTLSVVKSDAERLVPLSLAKDFPELPGYAIGKPGVGKTPDSKKRARETEVSEMSSTASSVGSPSPKKPAREVPTMSKLAQAFNRAPTSSDNHESNVNLRDNDSHALLQPNYLPPPQVKQEQLDAYTTPPPPGTTTTTNGGTHLLTTPTLPPTPLTAHRSGLSTNLPLTSPPHQPALTTKSDPTPPPAPAPASASTDLNSTSSGLTNSASQPQESPIKISAKTLRAQLDLVNNVFVKHDTSNWIAHTCLIATDLDQARRSLQSDLYATDEAFISGRELEQALVGRGFTTARIDTFIKKVLKVLDGIALADEMEAAAEAEAEGGVNGDSGGVKDDTDALTQELTTVMIKYPEQTRESMTAAAKVLEYLHRGKIAQEQKRLDVERRVKVLEGMVQIGEQVSSVVRFLLTEDK